MPTKKRITTIPPNNIAKQDEAVISKPAVAETSPSPAPVRLTIQDLIGGMVGFIFTSIAAILGSPQTIVCSILIAFIILYGIYLGRNKETRDTILEAIQNFLLVAFMGGVAGVGALFLMMVSTQAGFGPLAKLNFYIVPHMVFTVGLRFVHPLTFKKINIYLERAVLIFLYSFPIAVFTFSVASQYPLYAIYTSQFLSSTVHEPSFNPTHFIVFEYILTIIFLLAFYGYGIAMNLQSAEGLTSLTRDTVIVGTGDGILIFIAALLIYKLGNFPTTLHTPSQAEWATCFMFSALLSAAVFNAYRLRRIYALNKSTIGAEFR